MFTQHLFSQNPATNTENSAQSRSEHIFMELTLFVFNINSQYFCIKSGLNYLRYKRYKRNETEGHIFFFNLNFHRNGIHILYIDCYYHRKIYSLHWLFVPLYIEHLWTIIYHINTFKSYFMRFSASLDLSSVFINKRIRLNSWFMNIYVSLATYSCIFWNKYIAWIYQMEYISNKIRAEPNIAAFVSIT